jgi:hypothetical protein
MDWLALLDTRLMDLATLATHPPIYARSIARTQAWTAERSGHMLALNDEYVWRRIKDARWDNDLPDVRVRCLHCFAVATLRDWATAAELWLVMRDELAADILQTKPAANVRWLYQCDGAVQAQGVLNLLDTLCE